VALVELEVAIGRHSYLQGAVTGSTIRSIVAEPLIRTEQQRIALGARLEEIRWETGRRVHVSKLVAGEAIWPAIVVVGARESVIALRESEGAIEPEAQV
jgi:hypothetical protein